MLFQTVLVPTTLIALNADKILASQFSNTPETRFQRHASQTQFMSHCYNTGTSLLNSMQTTQSTQPVQKEQQHQAQHIPSLFQCFEQRQRVPVAAPVHVANATIAPARKLRSHPTQSNLVQRFASIFSPFMDTNIAACEPQKTKAPEPTSWGRWTN
ncbi:MAG: hypothetical protein SGBAC_008403 [Bacillariaceae sp.]